MSQDQGGPDRLPPQSRDAERSVLGSMLRDNGVIGDVIQIVRTESFYADAHQKIFEAMTKGLYDKGQPVDLITLANVLQEQKQIEDIGGYAYLAGLWDAAPTAANAEYYARIVRDKALVRHLIHASTEILRDAYDQAQPADEMLEGAERKILDIAQMGVTGQTYTLEEALQQAYDRIDTRHQKDEFAISGLATGFVDLDDKTAGLQNSELIILAARPSVGKTAMAIGIVRHIAVDDGQPVFFVSLEQSRIELAERLLCCQARVDSHRLRKGTLNSDDMQKLIDAGGTLRSARLFIDDTPGQGMLRIAANARRLKLRHNIKLVVIDYLQLIEPDNRRDPRQEQVAQISRRLKFLARELQIPVMALAQVNRSSEDRQDHKPRLADLRESGCLAGDTLVTLADSGARVPIRDLAGRSGFRVWALDEMSMRLKPAVVSNAFCTGRKPVYRLETRLGRTIRATANHKFRTLKEWKRLDELQSGECIALPRVIPCGTQTTITPAEAGLLGHLIGDGCTLPRHAIQYTTREEDLAHLVADLGREVFSERIKPRIRRERQWYQVYLAAAERLTHGRRNPVAEWLDRLGVFGLRSYEKRVPEEMFEQGAETVAAFLRHLWATDGCIRAPQGKTRHPQIYYASSSEQLVRDVQGLLLYLGINAVLRSRDQGSKGRMQFHLLVMGHHDIMTFAEKIGTVGVYKSSALTACLSWISGRGSKTNRDVIPSEVWPEYILPALQRNGTTLRQVGQALGSRNHGNAVCSQNVSRERLARVVAAAGGDEHLSAIASSDVYWDRVVSVKPDGEDEVFDLTVPGPANFVSGYLLSHNSIEQDADTVMLLHRPELYEPGQHEGIIEVIIAKQRNGPTGEVTLTFLKQYMRFENFAVASPFGIDS
ncbi:MAG: replicative DNA helicase [Gemmataceae bacterium]|nr:replicative DNA helicase [Gemmataceae bacterium]